MTKNISISTLNISDRVLTGLDTKNQPEYSKVLSFFHNQADIDAKFIRLYIQPTTFITLTPRHLILTRSNSTDQFEYKPAVDVKPGDILKLFDFSSSTLKSLAVYKRDEITLKKSGIYAPLTETGTIIVDSVQASCYSVVKSHRIAQFFYGALNSLNNLFNVTSENYFLYSKFLFGLVDFTQLKGFFLNLN